MSKDDAVTSGSSLREHESDSDDTNVPPTTTDIVEPPDWPCDALDAPGVSLLRRLLHWGPLFALFLIACIGFCTVIFLSSYWPPFDTLDGALFMSVFLLFNYLTLTNYLQAVYIGGGYIKKEWVPAETSWHQKLQFCHTCKGFKAPRSHHCSQCGRCVMKMDHHCPWINNCVGHRNHAVFIKFLLFATCGCIQSAIVTVKAIVITLYTLFTKTRPVYFDEIPFKDGTSFIAATIAGIFATGVAVALSALLYSQLKIVITNKTFVEDYICHKADVRIGAGKFVYPYDLGRRRNISEIFMHGTFPNGNGVWWPVVKGCDQFSFSMEQLKQKERKAENTHVFVAGEDYDGSKICGPMKMGMKVCLCQPYTDGRRSVMKKGEYWAVTRGMHHWAYGRLVVKTTGESDEQEVFVNAENTKRGWVPRRSLVPYRKIK